MKKYVVVVFCVLHIVCFGQQKNVVSIIPEPVSIKQQTGMFTIPGNIVINMSNQDSLKNVAAFLQKKLSKATGYNISAAGNAANAAIQLTLNKTADNKLGSEGYNLSVTPQHIIIKANTPAGIFYGIQTLYQLMPAAIEGKIAAKNVVWKIPCVEITDYPRFAWRGLMFDVARHFFTKQEVKDFIDQMVKYKFNLLHWHLTDDEGWRIEIKSLPELTKKGAYNVKKVGYFGTFDPPKPDEPRNYGGFYTQEDIKEVVAYAKERFVM